jgi:WD40 repeat protein
MKSLIKTILLLGVILLVARIPVFATPVVKVLAQEYSASVEAVAFSPDGKTALSGSDDSTIKWWDLKNGRLIKTLNGHSKTVTAVVFSPNGQTALSASDDNTIKWWDLKTGRILKTLSGHTENVRTVKFSPDGKTALSGSSDKTIKWWRLERGWNSCQRCLIKTLTGHSDSVTSVAFSPNGRWAISGSNDKTIKLWNLHHGLLIKTLTGHTDSVWEVAISPDGQTALSASWDGSSKWWNLADGYTMFTYQKRHSIMSAAAFSPKGDQALLGKDDNLLIQLDLPKKRIIREWQGHSDSVLAVAFSADGDTALSGSRDSTTRLWNVKTGQQIVQLVAFKNGEWITVTPEGYYVASAHGDRYLQVRSKDNKSTYHRPDVVEWALKLGNSQQAIVQANRQQQVQRQQLAQRQPRYNWLSTHSATDKKRLALVIGNSNYDGEAFLTNPVNDAEDLAKVLRKLGFEVVHQQNLNLEQMEKTIQQFGRQLRSRQGVGLFYFSGHGVQHNGENYLIPIGAKDSLNTAGQLRYQAVATGYVLETMKGAGNQTNLMILDACRNSPFKKSWYKGEMIAPGLTSMQTAPGALIAYAASPGGVALNGKGRNSPYVKHLIQWIQQPKLSINQVLRQVRQAVRRETDGLQSPGYYDELNEVFYFKQD